jgi:hypothetical protein
MKQLFVSFCLLFIGFLLGGFAVEYRHQQVSIDGKWLVTLYTNGKATNSWVSSVKPVQINNQWWLKDERRQDIVVSGAVSIEEGK